MNTENFALAERLVPAAYVRQGANARRSLEKNVRILLEQRKLPAVGWSERAIEQVIGELAAMDSNNFPEQVGVGEREARVFSRLVARRHFHLGHGVGRSGDIAEVQPKAAGSSLLAKLVTSFSLDILKMCGVPLVKSAIVLPVATGMALVLTMLTLRDLNPEARYVVFPRIDQKSCFKSILTAGFEPLVVEPVIEGDELHTDVAGVTAAIERVGASRVLCVLTTTSCFAPRVPDDVEAVAALCADRDVPHLVNNAYGVQSSRCMHIINQAARVGRVDAFVQSTDKNFMVPVGGTVVAGFDASFIAAIGRTYPGRASASPSIDLFVTLLEMGCNGYKRLLEERKDNYRYLSDEMKKVAERNGERLLETERNPISLAISLTRMDAESDGNADLVTILGSNLFTRGISGTRIVTPHARKMIGTHEFVGWGAHTRTYHCSYLSAAAAIGMRREDVDRFVKKLDKGLVLFERARASQRVGAPLPTVAAAGGEDGVDDENDESIEDALVDGLEGIVLPNEEDHAEQ